MAVKTFTTGEVLTASDTNTYLANAGLVYITQIAFTNQTTVSINNCFTSTYDWYRVEYSVNSTSTAAGRILTVQLLTGSTPAATNYSSGMRAFNLGLGTATWDAGGNSTTLMYCGYAGEPNFSPASGYFDMFWPAVARHTTQTGQAHGLSSSVAYYNMTFGGHLQNTTIYDGLRFAATADNITGTIRVYGYRQA